MHFTVQCCVARCALIGIVLLIQQHYVRHGGSKHAVHGADPATLAAERLVGLLLACFGLKPVCVMCVCVCVGTCVCVCVCTCVCVCVYVCVRVCVCVCVVCVLVYVCVCVCSVCVF